MHADRAARERALRVNLGILARQHGGELSALVRRHAGAGARRAAGRLLDAILRDARWTPSLRRDLAAVIAALAATGTRQRAAPSGERVAWHLARLREIAAQGARVDALATMLETLAPTVMNPLTPRRRA
jgi:hypothetical protein